eukprot:gb/GEZJ01004843.1/.p1 GENE.gb/GEZJ01004843.1/~~gb/GEZJ01004843.1/.p1  ORF type:complete len:147 (+),score=21.61 gb/GEZJ01004843.1/:69-509(+)
MPPSMRAMSATFKRRHEEQKQEKLRRQAALQLLKNKLSIRQTAIQTNASSSTVQQLRKALKANAKPALEKLLDPINHHPGRQFVIKVPEQLLVVNRAFKAAKRGFAKYNNKMKLLLAGITEDGRDDYKNFLPSDETLRRFRAKTGN